MHAPLCSSHLAGASKPQAAVFPGPKTVERRDAVSVRTSKTRRPRSVKPSLWCVTVMRLMMSLGRRRQEGQVLGEKIEAPRLASVRDYD